MLWFPRTQGEKWQVQAAPAQLGSLSCFNLELNQFHNNYAPAGHEGKEVTGAGGIGSAKGLCLIHIVTIPVANTSLHPQDTREKKWRIQAVSVQPGSFENRRSLPASWRGLRDEELSNASGIPGMHCIVSKPYLRS